MEDRLFPTRMFEKRMTLRKSMHRQIPNVSWSRKAQEAVLRLKNQRAAMKMPLQLERRSRADTLPM